MKRRAQFFILAMAVIVIVLLMFIPGFDDTLVRRNEASAVGHLRTLTILQTRYATGHPSKGFTCELGQLRIDTPPTGEYDPEAFLLADSWAGYRFGLSGCDASPNGVVVRYTATAVPVSPGKTGVRAFCADQSSELWFDASGSPENCLAAHRALL